MNVMRNAFSLLELILALALSVVLIGLIGSTFSFYATKLDARNAEVRRSMLAYALIDMMTDDLRAALYPPEFDPSSLEASISMGTGGGGAMPGEGQDLSAAGLDDMSDGGEEDAGLDDPLMASESAETADLSTGSLTTSRPGLIGNQTQVQFDISRLPRVEEYQQLIGANEPGTLADVPSDIKTITYYVQSNGGPVEDPLAVDSSTTNFSPNGNGGLVRRSLDRAVTNWALQNGGFAGITATGDLLATEVTSVSFRYWDGIQWMLFWNSDEMGTLPLAIEVTLTMLDQPVELTDAGGSPMTRQYVHVIRLPSGRPVEDDTGDLTSAGI